MLPQCPRHWTWYWFSSQGPEKESEPKKEKKHRFVVEYGKRIHYFTFRLGDCISVSPEIVSTLWEERHNCPF